jgi:hypothetical protein
VKKKMIVIIVTFSFLVLGVSVFAWYKGFWGEQKPGKCLILDNRYCRLVKKGNDYYPNVIVNLKEVNVFSPVAGKCDDKKFTYVNGTANRVISIDYDSNGRTFSYSFMLSDLDIKCPNDQINKGDALMFINRDKEIKAKITIISWKTGDENDRRINSKVEEELLKKFLGGLF